MHWEWWKTEVNSILLPIDSEVPGLLVTEVQMEGKSTLKTCNDSHKAPGLAEKMNFSNSRMNYWLWECRNVFKKIRVLISIHLHQWSERKGKAVRSLLFQRMLPMMKRDRNVYMFSYVYGYFAHVCICILFEVSTEVWRRCQSPWNRSYRIFEI